MTDTRETARLALRRFADTDSDAQLLFDLDADPEVMRYIGPFALPTVAAYRDLIRDRVLRFDVPGTPRGGWAVHDKPTGEFLGWIFLRPAPDAKFAAEAGWTRPTDLEVGYRFRRVAWGRGLATEGATLLVELGLADPAVTGVVGMAMVTNLASCRVLEKCGLVRQREFAVPGEADPSAAYARCRDGCAPPGPGVVRLGG